MTTPSRRAANKTPNTSPTTNNNANNIVIGEQQHPPSSPRMIVTNETNPRQDHGDHDIGDGTQPQQASLSSSSADDNSNNNNHNIKLHVVVIVLGDLGRSPRMQYHALSLLQHGHDVSLVGYTGEKLIPALLEYTDHHHNPNGNSNNNNNSNRTPSPTAANSNNNNADQEQQSLLQQSATESQQQQLQQQQQRPPMFSQDSKLHLRMESGIDPDGATERDEEDLATLPFQHQQQSIPPNKKGRLNVVRFAVPAPEFLQKVRVLYFCWRIVSLALWLSWALLFRVTLHRPRHPRPTNKKSNNSNNNDTSFALPHCVLVQNPPALPLLLVARLYCWWLGIVVLFSRSSNQRRKIPGLIVDWHNLGYSMLAEGSPFRKVAKVYESIVAPFADAHLTVTNAMKAFLESELRLPPEKVRVLPDCPPHMFQPRTLAEQHAILQKLHPQLTKACRKSWPDSGDGHLTTLLTEYNPKTQQYTPRRGRAALITSSTSWTPDEDFGILLNALLLLDKLIMEHRDEHDARDLRVMVVVTGKGPEKAQYEVKISKLTLHHVAVTTLWLEPGDYPPFLACADVGVSLHTSTSGLDLPMKVLDLFGCQVPVCAMDFDCLSELVQDEVNGRVFADSAQLAHQLLELLQPLVHQEQQQPLGVPCHSFGKLQAYSQQLQHRQRWHTNWDQNALPVLEQVTTSSTTGVRRRQGTTKPDGPTNVNNIL